MQHTLSLPNIKTSLIAAAITVAALTLSGGSASATTMPPQHEQHNATHTSSMQHDSHAQQQMHEQTNEHQMHEQHNNHEQHQAHGEHQQHAEHGQQHGNSEAAHVQHANMAQQNGNTQQHEQNGAQHKEQLQAGADLRVGLNNLLAEHVTTNVSTNRSIAGHAPQAEIDAGVQAQLPNSDAIAAAVGSVYGVEAQTQFSEMFREHLVESNAYAQAVAAGDESAKVAANEELQEYLGEIATFFSTAIPVLSYDAVYGLLNEHETLINNSTEAYKMGDYAQSYHFEHKALMQVATIADALASGIIATQPDKF